MTEVPLYIVDAFTAAAFGGNPAAVCVLARDLPDAAMQAIAAEMKHSETAFARPLDGPPERASRFSLRWFTPEVEVPLCGHATLATAAVLFAELGNPARQLHFETRGGRLAAGREGARIGLDFPAANSEPATVAPAILDALGADGVEAACRVRNGRSLLLHLGDERRVRDLAPDFARLRAARGEASFVGVIVTAAGSDGYDFVSRFFAPWVGVDEDPVTGSAHCALGPYWAGLTGKREMRAYQASPRGGEMTVRLREDRVDLVGEAVVVAAARLRLP